MNRQLPSFSSLSVVQLLRLVLAFLLKCLTRVFTRHAGQNSPTISKIGQVRLRNKLTYQGSQVAIAIGMLLAGWLGATGVQAQNGLAFMHGADDNSGAGVGVSIWVSNGDGTFKLNKVFDTGFSRDNNGTEVFGDEGTAASFFVDVTGDGIVDILQATETGGNAIYVYPGNGKGGFAKTPIATTGMQNGTDGYNFAGIGASEESFMADVDGDGDLDYAFSGNDDKIHVYLGNGNGTFATSRLTTALTGATGYHTSGVSSEEITFLTDVNGDGKADLVVTGQSPNAVNVWLATSGGSFATTPINTTGFASTGSSIFLGKGSGETTQLIDITGDGKPDLVHASEYNSQNNIFVYAGNGAGGFATTYTASLLTNPPGTSQQAIGDNAQEFGQWVDVTGDGKPDFVSSHDALGTNSGIYVWVNTTSGAGTTATFNPTPIVSLVGCGNFQTGSDNTETTKIVKVFTTGTTFASNGRPIIPGSSISPGGVSADLAVWFRAEDLVSLADGATVGTWSDAVTAGGSVSQSNESNKPTLNKTTAAKLINFNPSLSFNGNASNYLTNDQRLYCYTSQFHLTTVALDERTNLGDLRAPMGIGSDGDNPAFDLQTDGTSPNGWNLYMTNSSPNEWTGGGALLFNGNTGGSNRQPQVFALSSTNLTSSATDNIISSVDSYTQATTLDAHQQTQIGNGMFVGSSGSQYWIGRIPEVLVYSRQLNATEQKQVNSYLATKYGISLDQRTATDYVASDGTTKFWDSSVNGIYNKDIAAIGRDDASGLNQKQSQSVNRQVQPIISLVTIAASNTANAGSFGADKAFTSWGNDGRPHSYSTVYTPTTFTPAGGAGFYRMAATWKVQETGTIGTVVVGIGSSSGADYLLVSNSPGFPSGSTQELALTSDGNGHLVASVNFTSGQYFTYGAADKAPGGVIAGLNVWLKADALDGNDGDKVATWSSSVLSVPYSVSQATTSKQPTIGTSTTALTNYNQSVNFTRSAGMVLTNNTTALTPGTTPSFHYIAVAQDNDPSNIGSPSFGSSNLRAPMGNGSSGDNPAMDFQKDGVSTNGWNMSLNGAEYNGGHATIYNGGGIGSGIQTLAPGYETRLLNQQPQIFGIGFTWAGPTTAGSTSTSRPNMWVDGFTEASTNQTVNNNSANQANFFLGSSGGSEYWNGPINEMIQYTRELSSTEMQKVNTYLAIKYGTTLGQGSNNYTSSPVAYTAHVGNNFLNYNYVATDGTVVWDATTNSAYGFDIAGIGQDNFEGLSQRQSKSENAGFQPAFGLGTLAVSNDANSGSFGADRSYMIWGHNGSPTSYTVSYTPSFAAAGGVYAMGRIWKVAETGTVGTVTVSIPGSGVGNYLLVFNSPSFTSGATEIAMTDDGSGNLTAQVDLADGQYFTFARTAIAPGGVLSNLWFRADLGVTPATSTTATVTTWTDQAQVINATQIGTNATPTVVAGQSTTFNFNPGVQFSNLQRIGNQTATPLTSGTALDYYMVTKEGMTGTRVFNFNGLPAGTGASSYDEPAFLTTLLTARQSPGFGSISLIDNYNPVLSTTNTSITSFSFSASQYQMWANGLPGPVLTRTNIGLPAQGFVFGRNADAPIGGDDDGFNGQIAEVIALDRNGSLTDRLRIQSYLGIKYGITLPHNYLAADGTTIIYNVSSYSANVTGIGRDDVEALQQKQSKSVNPTTAFVTLGIGTGIAASNAANANTFTADKSYEIIGDNGLAASYITAYTPSSFSPTTPFYSMPRIWKVAETGTVGTVTISITGNIPGAYLLVNNTPSFTSGATEIPMTSDGNGNMTAQVDLSNGQFFTFGAPASTLIGHSTYDMIDGMTPAVAPVYNPCFSGPQGIWQKTAVYKTGYTNGPASGIAPGETASESTFIVDIDKDGNKDLVWVFDAGNTVATAGVYVWKGNGDGTFATAAIKDVGTFTGNGVPNGTANVLAAGGTSSTESTHIADMNGDGNLDLIWMFELTNSTYVWLGNGDGTFQHTAIYKTGYAGGPNSGVLSVGLDPKESTFLNDIDNDGKIDIVWVFDAGPAVATAGVYIWKGNGDGTFATTATKDLGAFTGNSLQNGTSTLALGGITATETTHLADFNGDGKADLLWAYEGTNSTYVWLGNGDGTFQHNAIYKTGYTGAGPSNNMPIGFSASENTNIVDADGDGKLDIVWVYDGGVAVATAGAYVWRGNGDGTFATAATKDIGTFTGNSVANGTANVALGGWASTESSHVTDLNNDGKVDLLWLHEGTNTSYAWLAGCTQIAILSPTNNTQASTNPVISGTATPGSTVTIKGPGNTTLCTTVATSGTFSCPVSVTAGPQTLTAIATSADGASSNSATVSFTAVASLTAASSPTPLTVVSGAPNSGSAATAIALSGGTAPLTYSVFNPSSGSATGASTVTTAHGIATINPTTGAYSYTATPGYSGTDAIGIKVCDSGSPQQCTSAVLPINVIAPIPAKQSNDGFYSDGVGTGIYGADCYTTQFWRHAPILDIGTFTGTPPASPANYIQAGYSNAEQTFTGDVNGDGKVDLIWVYEGTNSTNSGTTVWLGNGDGTFAHAPIIDIGSFTGVLQDNQTNKIQAGFSNAESTFMGDVNGDGKLDIIWIYEGANSATSGTAVWLGNGNGTWSHTAIMDRGSFTSAGQPGGAIIQAGQAGNESTYMTDVNGDGKLDIVWLYDANGGHAASGTWTWLGNGDGTWNHTPIADMGNFATFIQAGATVNESTFIVDVNTDGKPDVVFSNDAGGNSATSGTQVWMGNGDGTWNHTPVTDIGSFTGLVAGGSSNYIEGGLTNTESTRIVDVNGDGKPDLVWVYEGTSSSNSGTSVWLGNGDGTFSHTVKTDRGTFTGTPPQSIANVIQAGAANIESFFMVDLNNDSKLDIVWVVEGTTNGGTAVWLAGCTPTVAVNSPANNTQTSLNPVISGTATPGSTVVILGPGSTTLCSTVATSGTFACPVSVTAGPKTLTVVASNADGVSTPATVSFTAVLTSLTVASSPTPLTVASGVPASGSAATAIAPGGGTAPLTYGVYNPTSGSATSSPGPIATPHGLVSINPTTGAYSYTSTPGYSGTDAIGIKVCDSGTPQQCAATVIPITVTAPLTVNTTPASLTAAPNTSTPGSAATALNPQGGTQPLTYTSIDPVTGVASNTTPHGTVSMNPTTGAYTYTPTPGYSGTDAIGIKVCDSSTPPQCTTAVIPVTVSSPSSGTLDCSTAQISGIVAGTPGSGVLKLTMTVSTTGSFPVTVTGSGLSANPSPFAITIMGTGLQTFYVPLSYTGAAFGPTTITVTGAGVCSPDMSLVTPKTVTTSVLNLGPACTPVSAATLVK